MQTSVVNLAENRGPIGLGWLVCGLAATVPAGFAVAESPRPIVEVAGLPLEALESLPEVFVRGIATKRAAAFFVIQDHSSGIFVDVGEAAAKGIWTEAAAPEDIQPGIEVEVRGVAAFGGFSPVILPRSIRCGPMRPLPAPRTADLERFFAGCDVCSLTTIDGVVQGIERQEANMTFLTLETSSRTFFAKIGTTEAAAKARLLDAEVRLTGVPMAFFNSRGEGLAPVIYVDSGAGLEVLNAPRHEPFECPKVAIASLARFRVEPLRGHMIRTEGTVIHAVPGKSIYLQDAENGVLVGTAETDVYRPGDRVEVAGFVDRSGRVAGLKGALVRRIGGGVPPQPRPVDPAAVLDVNRRAIASGRMAFPSDYEGCLITFPATFVERLPGEAGGGIVLASGSSRVLAIADHKTFESLSTVAGGSTLEVVGIAQAAPSVDPAEWPRRSVDRLTLVLRSAADVRVLRRPSWWNPRRVATALALALLAMVAAGLAAGVWITVLRRQVRRQLRVIESSLRAEAVADERRRIAREFHDTIDQGLAGLALRFDAAAHQTADATTRDVLVQQRQLLSSLKDEARDFLWDLRDPTHLEPSLAASIRTQMNYLQSLTVVPLRLEAEADPRGLDSRVQYEIVRIVRESMGNAVKYAAARHVVVRLAATPAGGGIPGLRIEIEDNGSGFDVEERSHASGHYGIRGMRERARRIGATLGIRSEPGRGTLVLLELNGREIP